jgi:hypothetical protein
MGGAGFEHRLDDRAGAAAATISSFHYTPSIVEQSPTFGATFSRPGPQGWVGEELDLRLDQ